MGIESALKVGGKALTQVAKKAYVKPVCELRTLESLGLKMEQLSTDTVEIVSKAKNTIKMQQASSNKFLFYDGEQCIGHALIGEPLSNSYPAGHLPKSWYIPNGVLDEANRMPTYPRLYIDEIVIKDKKGFFEQYQQRASGKKYGTMCMQRILEYAEQNGYGTRISLGPAKHGSNIHPGKFYAKIGFEPGPGDIKYALKENERYYRGIKYVKEHPNLPEEIKEDYLDRIFYEQIDGRFVSTEDFAGEVFLTQPDVLRNYPL